jgi:AraC family transcriptional regulator of adaptative response/methylated-DNA-[protein]-cysteine methyltransferase
MILLDQVNMNQADKKWALVLARDASADGQFVYAVRSTRIFCRPSCPSRRPRREQVEFFASVAAAQQAGYRECRRCVPSGRNVQLKKVEDACRYIDEHLDTTLRLSVIAGHVGVSPFYFQRLFKRVLGISPREYQQARRAGKFKKALLTESRITDAVYEAGYASSSRAYETASARLGMTPSTFRRKGEGVAIRYTVVPTELGKLLIASTPRGICSVQFGASADALVSDLRREFPAATIEQDRAGLQETAAKLSEFVGGNRVSINVPLDIQGTAFQQLVWNALKKIPYGETRSYSEIARTLGKPKAVRAVANACARNHAALIVPCHRVVQKSGELSGYRWGVRRKAALLEKESSANRAM